MRTTIQSARSNTRPKVRCLCSAKVIEGGSARTSNSALGQSRRLVTGRKK
jgi:hypothetical protein